MDMMPIFSVEIDRGGRNLFLRFELCFCPFPLLNGQTVADLKPDKTAVFFTSISSTAFLGVYYRNINPMVTKTFPHNSFSNQLNLPKKLPY